MDFKGVKLNGQVLPLPTSGGFDGLFEIPISASSYASQKLTNSELSYIQDNLEAIKKGAYIKVAGADIIASVIMLAYDAIFIMVMDSYISISYADGSIGYIGLPFPLPDNIGKIPVSNGQTWNYLSPSELGEELDISKLGGLFEIPYDLTTIQSKSEGCYYILDNIEQIKKGAYFKDSNGAICFIDYAYGSDSTNCALKFSTSDTGLSGKTFIQYRLFVARTLATCVLTQLTFNSGDWNTYPSLITAQRSSSAYVRSYGDIAVTASPENEGKVVGVKDGNFAMVDVVTKDNYETSIWSDERGIVTISPSGVSIYKSDYNYSVSFSYDGIHFIAYDDASDIDVDDNLLFPDNGGTIATEEWATKTFKVAPIINMEDD